MAYLIIDTETELAGPRGSAPPRFVVLGALADNGEYTVIDDRAAAKRFVEDWMGSGATIVAHNLAFDLAVLGIVPAVAHHVWCTGLADILIRLATDDCSLERRRRVVGPPAMRKLGECLGEELEGKESTRLSYRPGVPLTEEQLRYLEADVRAHERLYMRQQRQGVPGDLPELNLQLRARLALDRLTCRGIPVDRAEIQRQRVLLGQQRREHRRELQEGGIYIPSRTGPRGGRYKPKLDTKAFRAHVERLALEAGIKPETTDGGLVATSSDFLRHFADDALVAAWLDYKGVEKLEGFLKSWDRESGRIHPGYRSMARTGRTTCHSPNLQQVPSRGVKGAVKAVFRPEAGCVMYEADYGQLELCTLAYLTQGIMRDFINEGRDLHRELGAVFFRKPASEVSKAERQFMKAANFGFPGGMGGYKFRLWCRAMGVPDPGEDAARALKDTWLRRYPEMVDWLKGRGEPAWDVGRLWAGEAVENDMRFVDPRSTPWSVHWAATGPRLYGWAWAWAEKLAVSKKIPYHLLRDTRACRGSPTLAKWLIGREAVVPGGRKRHPVTYTEQRNTPFQGLAANLTKQALAALVLDHHVCVHAFIHDSVVFSVPEEGHHEAARRAVDVMLAAARVWVPGVRVYVDLVGPGSNWAEAKNGAEERIYGDA